MRVLLQVCFIALVIAPSVFGVPYRNPCRFASGQGKNNFSPDIWRPRLDALCPKGLRVWIPSLKGLQLFGFEANLNKRINNREQGKISMNTTSPDETFGDWIIVDKDIQLKIGDSINYRIIAQVDDKEFFCNNLSFVVQEHTSEDIGCSNYRRNEIIPHSDVATNTIVRTDDLRNASACSPCSCGKDSDSIDSIYTQLNVTLFQLNTLYDVINPLQKQVESLTELVQQLYNNSNIGTKLLLQGSQPPKSNSLETIRALIVEKLDLPDLGTKIAQAYTTTKGIIFEMMTPIEKQRVLVRAKQALQHTKYSIVDAQLYDVDDLEVNPE